ncbi:DUF397 domain-containing protein [Streptomyces sp. NPDC053079]|uniref:DUF397 domain-containing protein n=1 Tax=Streptomyces sp. NPDC053079 TaxID=3365697 RepID=UPI0037CF12A6
MSQLEWRKSSRCTGGDGECVEVSTSPGGLIRLRESDRPADVLTTTPSALATLLTGIKAGRAVRRVGQAAGQPPRTGRVTRR